MPEIIYYQMCIMVRDAFPIADDQITSMVAGGALYEIEDVDAVKKG